MTHRLDWLEPELPTHASDISPRGRARLLSRARRDILHRTYTGTFAYPVLCLLGGWLAGLAEAYPLGLASVTAALTVIVVVRVILYKRALRETSRPSIAAHAHLLLGVGSAAAFASALGCAYVGRDADASVTAGFVVVGGIAGTVVMIATTHRRLAIIWVIAGLVPGLVAFVVAGLGQSHVLMMAYLVYLPVLRKMIDKGHEAYWDAQVSAMRLDEQSQELARLTRAAGMAENATNVLHDVGNALNSVRTSTTCLVRAQAMHPSPDLHRLLDLLAPHHRDLGAFLATDSRGARVISFLQALSDSARSHATTTRAEIGRVEAQLEHIEVIVRRQQTIATGVGDSEPCRVRDLVDAALGLAGIANDHPRIDVIQAIEDHLHVVVDRHRALQILVNLLDNARDAMRDNPSAGRIRIRARAVAEGDVEIEIEDDGTGIRAADAPKLFMRGFTTKPHGHGFGLHGSFALAQAMHGELSFVSSGAARGATFRVRLPSTAIVCAA